MKSIIFDIETIPDIEGIKKILTNSVSDINEKTDAEILYKFWQTKKPDIDLATAQSSFLPNHLHKVVTIGLIICDFEDNSFNMLSLCANKPDEEKNILKQFFGGLEKYKIPQPPQLVSWNGCGFDLPVLQHRSMIHSVVCPIYWEVGETRGDFRFNHYLNRYQYRHLDLMDVLAGYNGRNYAKLDDMSKLCDFPGKHGLDGSKVAEEYNLGNIDKIANYCEVDVINTFLLYLRFLLISGRIDKAKSDKIINNTNLWLDENRKDDFWISIKESLKV